MTKLKQVVQHLKSGRIRVIDVPVPQPDARTVLVRATASVISSGTERAKVQTGQQSLLQMARSRPDQVKKVLETARSQGVGDAIRRVLSRLDAYSPLGYSMAGTVCGGDLGAAQLRAGQRVACVGGEWAFHADFVVVPPRFAVPIPDGLSDRSAAFAGLGSIALHALHQADVAMGERVVIVGLGLVGQLAVQLAAAAGCAVSGVDPNGARQALASRLVSDATTCQTLAEVRNRAFGGRGMADHVLVTASSQDPGLLGACLAVLRDRGRITIVGDVPVAVDRREMYAREIELRIARSYGPGRHRPEYEWRGEDLPANYVRWSIERNMAEVLRLMALGRVNVDSLISASYAIDDAAAAYDELTRQPADALALVLTYREETAEPPIVTAPAAPRHRKSSGTLRVGMVGAGSFATNVVVPVIRSMRDVELAAVASAGGVSAARLASRAGFGRVCGSATDILDDDTIDIVLVLTRHDSHGPIVLDAMRRGKHVFVEKPLTIDANELAEIADLSRSFEGVLAVGFNRRFSPHIDALRDLVTGIGRPVVVSYRMNVGALPVEHWTHDPVLGGGRILGEACHAIDTLSAIIGQPVEEVSTMGLPLDHPDGATEDSIVATLSFVGGSIGTVAYTAIGAPRSGKERVEVFVGGWSGVCDDFRVTRIVGPSGQRVVRRKDKGHRAQFEAFFSAVRGEGETPWDAGSVVRSTAATFAMRDSLRFRCPVRPNV